jgi:hypothetical protein
MPLNAHTVADTVGKLGDNYKQYQTAFVDNGFDGTMLLALVGVSDPDVSKLLENDLGITNSFHRQRIILELQKLRVQHTA